MPAHRYPEGLATELFAEDVSAFECELCQCVVRDPLEHAGCSQMFCADCVKAALTHMRPPACPHCMAPAALGDFRRVNRLLRQMLDAKQMHCLHYPECSHLTTFGRLEKHLAECPLQPVTCRFNGCEEQILRQNVAAHEETCVRRTQRCEFCDTEVLASAMDAHRHTFCLRIPVPCKFCDMHIPRDSMSKHCAEDCEKQPVKCVIEGCAHTMPKSEIQSHLDANLGGHLAQMQQQMLDVNKLVAEMKDEITALRLTLVQKDEAIEGLRSQVQQLQQQQQQQKPFGGAGFQAPTLTGFSSAGFGKSGFGSSSGFGQATKKSNQGHTHGFGAAAPAPAPARNPFMPTQGPTAPTPPGAVPYPPLQPPATTTPDSSGFRF